jgi:DNA-binding NtrC family response regulator
MGPLEKQYVEELLARFANDLDAAAKSAGLHRKSFLRLVRKHGLAALAGVSPDAD